jgi:hypothetical protein
MPAGRPSKYSEALGKQICEEMIAGRSLRSICDDDWCPAISNVCNWLVNNKEFQEQYARAREAQAEILADEIIQLADECREGTKTKVTDKGTEIYTGDMVERSRLQVDARKWVAARLLPKKYGDKVAVTDPDGNQAVVRVLIEHVGHQGKASA